MKECCAVVLALTHWRPFLFGKHFTYVHRSSSISVPLSHARHIQHADTLGYRLANFQFHGQAHIWENDIVFPTHCLSRLVGDVNLKLAVNESALASICRNVPNDRPYHSARPRDFEISTQSLDQLGPVQNGRQLFASAVSVFPLIDPEAFVKLQKEEFGEYFKFLSSPTDSTVAVPAGETPHSMSQFFLQRECNVLFRSYLSGYSRKRSSFLDQLVVPSGFRQ